MTKRLLPSASSNAPLISASTSQAQPSEFNPDKHYIGVDKHGDRWRFRKGVNRPSADTKGEAACSRDLSIREGKQKGLHRFAKLNFATQEEAENVAAQARAAFEQDMAGKKRRKKYTKPGTRAKPRPPIPLENPVVKASQAVMIIERCVASCIRCGGANLINIMNSLKSLELGGGIVIETDLIKRHVAKRRRELKLKINLSHVGVAKANSSRQAADATKLAPVDGELYLASDFNASSQTVVSGATPQTATVTPKDSLLIEVYSVTKL